MLPISKISHTVTHSDAWRKERLGKFTASKIGKLMSKTSDKGIFTTGAITYIESLAGETITGQPSEQEFFNSNIDHGNATEPEAIRYYASISGRAVVRNEHDGTTHRLIVNDELTACTPDALFGDPGIESMDKLFDATGENLKVIPFEGKCPPVFHRYIKLFKCKTPNDLLLTEPDYYWQVIAQIEFCNALRGIFMAYNPIFTVPARVIEFSKNDLRDDFKKMNLTLSFAKEELKKTINLLKQTT